MVRLNINTIVFHKGRWEHPWNIKLVNFILPERFKQAVKSNFDLSKTTENRALQLVKADQKSVRNDHFGLKSKDFKQEEFKNEKLDKFSALKCFFGCTAKRVVMLFIFRWGDAKLLFKATSKIRRRIESHLVGDFVDTLFRLN